MTTNKEKYKETFRVLQPDAEQWEVQPMKKKKGLGLLAKQEAAGWGFLAPASLLIFIMSFYPMVRAFITSLQTGPAAKLKWAEPLIKNYTRMVNDKVFLTSMGNTFLYLLIQVPIMLVLAILLAQLLNNKDLKFRGLFRTLIFLPCATALVSYALIFKTLFATQGLINSFLMGLGIGFLPVSGPHLIFVMLFCRAAYPSLSSSPTPSHRTVMQAFL